MHITIVVQRYGAEVLGGAETLARQVGERLTRHFDVDVLTTCALDYTTWENAFSPGASLLNGVRVHRFPTIQQRHKHFDRLSAGLFGQPHSIDEELEWLYAQGPWAPALLEAILQRRDKTDVFIFFTYIYYPTALGLRLVADKALLVPTAHDEPPVYLNVFKALFHAPRGILYNTEEERAFVEAQFGNAYVPNCVAGLGVETPSDPDVEGFRNWLGLSGPYFLYLGRIVESKGCDELLSYFRRFWEQHAGAASLVLLGKAEMPLPRMPGLVYGGFVSEQAKFEAIAGATAVVIPSRYESLSMTALEAWAMGRPVVTTAQGRVVSGMSRRGNCGLYYRTMDEFVEILKLLLDEPVLSAALGRQGRRFVAETYAWDEVVDKYQAMVDHVTSHPWGREVISETKD